MWSHKIIIWKWQTTLMFTSCFVTDPALTLPGPNIDLPFMIMLTQGKKTMISVIASKKVYTLS